MIILHLQNFQAHHRAMLHHKKRRKSQMEPLLLTHTLRVKSKQGTSDKTYR